MKPVLLVIAGPNGAGKTTVTRTMRIDASYRARLSNALSGD